MSEKPKPRYIIITFIIVGSVWFGYWLSYQTRDEIAERHIKTQQKYITELENCIKRMAGAKK